MPIKTYSYAKDGATLRSPDFKISEFRCKDGSDAILIDDALVAALQAIRDHFGAPIEISSAYRTKTYNADVGGAKDSQHLYGTAADIRVMGVNPRDVARWVEANLWGKGVNGIGLYDYSGKYTDRAFVHIDTRTGKPAQWIQTAPNAPTGYKVVGSITRDYLGAQPVEAIPVDPDNDLSGADPAAKPRTLKQGLAGTDVAELVGALIKLGYCRTLAFDGNVKAAVMTMQEAAGIEVDGEVGPVTRAALAAMLEKEG